MNFRLFPVVIVWLGLLAPVQAQEPDPTELLNQSQKALNATDAFDYEANYVSEGAFAQVIPSQRGHVTLARNNSPMLKLHATIWAIAPDGRAVVTSELISDGSVLASIAHDRKQYRELTGPAAGGEMLRWKGMIQEQLLRGDMYKTEIASGAAVYRGSEAVDGVECHVIEAKNPAAPAVTTQFYIGKKDLFPRRVVRAISGGKMEGRAELTLNSLDSKPVIGQRTFAFYKPEGYTDRGTPLGPRPVASPLEAQFLPIGSEAPDWTLRTPDNKEVSFKDLRGKVVLLAFWSTWASPCANAVPVIQKLRDAYKDRPVALYLVNAFESCGDPAKQLQRFQLAPYLLLNGDSVAVSYLAQGVPTLYVISPEGKVLLAEGGVLHDQSIKETIDRALEGMSASSKPTAQTAP